MCLRVLRSVAASLLALAILGTANPAWTETRTPTATNKLFMYSKPAVVRIYCGYVGQWNWGGQTWRTQMVGSGSGFLFNPKGYVLTNAHVVSGLREGDNAGRRGLLFQLAIQVLRAKGLAVNQQSVTKAAQILANQASLTGFQRIALVVLQSGRRVPFEIKAFGAPSGEGRDLATGKDVAVLKVEVTNAPTLKIGNSDDVQVGDRVYLLGYPGAADSDLLDSSSILEPTINDGAISSKKATTDGAPILQTNTSATHGNSGGPVLNEKGEVIGLLTFRGNTINGQEVQGFNFIVPTSTAMEFVHQAGTGDAPSPLDQKWREGLNYYWNGEYRNARGEFQSVQAMFADHGEAVRLSRECEEHIARGDDKSMTGNIGRILLGGCGILVVLLAVLLGVWWLARRRPKAPAATVAAPPPVPSPAPPVGNTAPVAGKAPRVAGTEVFRGGPAAGNLRCLAGPHQGQVFPVGQGLYLGRDAARAQLVVQDTMVSGQHVWVGPLAGRVVAKDAGSTNGTFLNDPATPRLTEVALKPGDRLFLGPTGSVVFEYQT